MHFKRLGITDDAERLVKTTILAGRSELLEHTGDLDEAVQLQHPDARQLDERGHRLPGDAVAHHVVPHGLENRVAPVPVLLGRAGVGALGRAGKADHPGGVEPQPRSAGADDLPDLRAVILGGVDFLHPVVALELEAVEHLEERHLGPHRGGLEQVLPLGCLVPEEEPGAPLEVRHVARALERPLLVGGDVQALEVGERLLLVDAPAAAESVLAAGFYDAPHQPLVLVGLRQRRVVEGGIRDQPHPVDSTAVLLATERSERRAPGVVDELGDAGHFPDSLSRPGGSSPRRNSLTAGR